MSVISLCLYICLSVMIETLNLNKYFFYFGQAGCIHLSSEVQSDTSIRVLLLWYIKASDQFKGRIPKDQAGFINNFRELIKVSLTSLNEHSRRAL